MKYEQYIHELEEIKSKIAEDASIYSSPNYAKIAKRQAFLEEVISPFAL